MRIPEAGGYDQLSAHLKGMGLEPHARMKTLYGRQLTCFRLEGSGPAVLITAGAHCDEIAGVFAALHLLESLDTDLDVYVIPCRDPLGWDGFRNCLDLASGLDLGVRSDHEAAGALRRHGDVLVDEGAFDGGRLLLAVVGELAFALLPYDVAGFDPRVHLGRYIPSVPDLVRRLRGLRIMTPGPPPYTHSRDPYGWGGGSSLYVSGDGEIGNMNRFFASKAAPAEVSWVRDIARQVRPGLTLDLHEGYGRRHYFFASHIETARGRAMIRAVTRAMEHRGYRPESHDVLKDYWGEAAAMFRHQGDGVYTLADPGSGNDTLTVLCGEWGPGLVTETGMDGALEDRVDMIVTAVLAALSVPYGEMTTIEGEEEEIEA